MRGLAAARARARRRARGETRTGPGLHCCAAAGFPEQQQQQRHRPTHLRRLSADTRSKDVSDQFSGTLVMYWSILSVVVCWWCAFEKRSEHRWRGGVNAVAADRDAAGLRAHRRRTHTRRQRKVRTTRWVLRSGRGSARSGFASTSYFKVIKHNIYSQKPNLF